MFYRKATTKDIEQLADLRMKQLIEEGANSNRIYDHTLDEIMNHELLSYFCSGIEEETLVVWVAADGDTIVSTCGVCFVQYPPTFSNPVGKTAYITDVYTEPGYRKQGIATKLLDDTMAEIAQRGVKLSRLHASEQAKGIYRKAGFSDADGFMVKRDC